MNQTLTQTVSLNQALTTSTQATVAGIGKLGVAYAVYSKIRSELSNATGEAVEFNSEIIRTRQLTKASATDIEDLARSTLGLATATGTSAAELAKVQRYILSAGVSAYDTKQAMEGLAKAAQTANFGTLADSTEAVLALFNAFHESGRNVAGDLDVMATLSSKFAVEQYQLIAGLKKSGVVIKDLGGDFKDFAALFTTIESSTREDAGAIGNSLKSLFVYLQRSNVRDFLKHNLSVDTRDSAGQFRNPVAVIQDIQHALANVKPTSPVFGQLADLLGVRNVSRLLPLLTDGEKLTRILAAAQQSGAEAAAQLAIKEQTVTQQLAKLHQQLVETIYAIGNNQVFKDMASAMIETGKSALSLASSLNTLTSIHFPKEVLALAGLAVGGGLLAKGGAFGRIGGAAVLGASAGPLGSSLGSFTGKLLGGSVSKEDTQNAAAISQNAIGFLLARSFIPSTFGQGLGAKAYHGLNNLSDFNRLGVRPLGFLGAPSIRDPLADAAGRIGDRIPTGANIALAGTFAGSALSGLASQNLAAGHINQGRA